WHAGEHTICLWILLALGVDSMLVQSLGPWLERHFAGLEILGDVADGTAGLPHAGEVWFAIGGARRGRRHVRLAVGQARHGGILTVEPLRGGGPGQQQNQGEALDLHGTLPSAPSAWCFRYSTFSTKRVRRGADGRILGAC